MNGVQKVYGSKFFQGQSRESYSSAKQVVPKIIELFKPRSVLDVGCGVGSWLKVFAENGVSDYLGLDGSYVEKDKLLIPADRFKAMDLTDPEPLNRKFDIAISLEVAEHLDRSCADDFVQFITSQADTIVFSAAAPGQGGTHHVNERWPEYWASRFAEQGYLAFDPIRPEILPNDEVAWWYRQNIIVFLSASAAGNFHQLTPLSQEFRLVYRGSESSNNVRRLIQVGLVTFIAGAVISLVLSSL